MRIAFIGWGSLVWQPRSLHIDGDWNHRGPKLPIEFSRISKDARLTLVVDPHNGVPVTTLYADCVLRTIRDAVQNLADREQTSQRHIGWACSVDGAISLIEYPDQANVHQEVLEWARRNRFDAAVWTALPSNFEHEWGCAFTPQAALQYLKGLPRNVRRRAYDYIDRTPPEVQTPVRSLLTQHDPPVPGIPSKAQDSSAQPAQDADTDDPVLRAGLILNLDERPVQLVRPERMWLVRRDGSEFLVRASIIEDAFFGALADACVPKQFPDFRNRFFRRRMNNDEENTLPR